MFPDATTGLFAVNSNRFLPRLPAISLSEQSDKQSQTELERNDFLVHRCTVQQKYLSTLFVLMMNCLFTCPMRIWINLRKGDVSLKN